MVVVVRDSSATGAYSSNLITKKEPKSDDRLSKFDWHDLSPIFLAIKAESFYDVKY